MEHQRTLSSLVLNEPQPTRDFRKGVEDTTHHLTSSVTAMSSNCPPMRGTAID
jgi:hypothetical protein